MSKFNSTPNEITICDSVQIFTMLNRIVVYHRGIFDLRLLEGGIFRYFLPPSPAFSDVYPSVHASLATLPQEELPFEIFFISFIISCVFFLFLSKFKVPKFRSDRIQNSMSEEKYSWAFSFIWKNRAEKVKKKLEKHTSWIIDENEEKIKNWKR